MKTRPPIITVMGHIDHGKTTLLDALRQTKVQQNESGGITQHIGAYQIEYLNKKLTFIDTPGHAAFTAMRSRGAKATDLVILVIDAQESVKPQTKESLKHIQAAKVPFLVAINKMDLPNAVPDIVKKDLADAGVSVEGFGGDIVCVPVSAKTKKGLEELLEMTLLLADMQNLKADPKGNLQGVVIESLLDKKQGPLATVIIKNGTLRVGDEITADKVKGKVKALFNEQAKNLKQVIPGQPAQVLGFKDVPEVGTQIGSELSEPAPINVGVSSKPSKPEPKEPANKTLPIILKADTTGTLEAITQNLSDEINLISSGVGDISESDVLLAQSTQASIITFRVKIAKSAQKLADIENILIKSYNLIHELLEDLQTQILKLLEPTINETILGEAKIIALFTVKGQQIAGCQVNSGKLSVNDQIHLKRQKDQIADSKIKSIHQGKDQVKIAKKSTECGITFTTDLDFKTKDTIVAYK